MLIFNVIMNWLDIVIVAVAIFYIKRGADSGAIKIITGFAGIIIAYIISINYYTPGEAIINHITHRLPPTDERLLSILVTFIIVSLIFNIISPYLEKMVPKKMRKSPSNIYGGALLSLAEFTIILSFLIFVIMNFNINTKTDKNIKNIIKKSYIGRTIIKENAKILQPVLGNDIQKVEFNVAKKKG